MKDIRISIRLSEEERKKLKILAIKENTNIQELIHDYINSLIGEKKK